MYEIPKTLNAGAPTPWDGGVTDPLETRSYATYVTMPNLVVLGQTIRA